MTSDTPLELTVCSVARTPADPVARLLDALAHQTAPNGSYDAVLVDATSSGAFASLQPVAGVTVHVVRVDADTSRADALNAGWRAASGRAIGFVAVDFVPARAWVESMATALRRGRRLVTGSLQPNPDTIDRAGGMSHRLWASRRALPLVTTDQMACLRDDLDRVDGFDPSVPAEVCDVDLAARLVDDGVDRFRSRHAVAFHDVEELD